MSDKSGIEWTDATWNPTTGCDRVSPGCDNCYALDLAGRLKLMGSPAYQSDGDPRTSGPGFKLTLHPDRLDQPLRWQKPRRIFVNSMSDLFHPDVPGRFVGDVWNVMGLAERHRFQILTKRPQAMRLWAEGVEAASCMWRRSDGMWCGPPKMWPLPNVWLGTSVESQKYAFRINHLLATPAAVRFLSLEPLLGPVDLSEWFDAHAPWNYTEFGAECSCGAAIVDSEDRCNGARIDWVIVGGESGPNHRPIEAGWVRDIRDQCVEAGVPFFFKQWGGRTPKAGGRVLDGRTWDEFPVDPGSLQ